MRYLNLENNKPFYSVSRGEGAAKATTPNIVVLGILNFFTWIILFTNVVPISLVVSLGIVKSIQGWHMGVDRAMLDRKTATFASVRTSDLNEELGQITHILTDKTGTLTANVMNFKRFAVGDDSFGGGSAAVSKSNSILRKMDTRFAADTTTPHVRCVAPEFYAVLNGDFGWRKRQKAFLYLLNLAVNHSVIVDTSGASNGAESGIDLRYMATSPDEEALVYGAKHFGVIFRGRNQATIDVEICGRLYSIEVLAYLEFTSDRKRSTCLVRLDSDLAKFIFEDGSEKGEIRTRNFVFVKGADSVILPLCEEVPHYIDRQLTEFCGFSLRTLCLAQREMTDEEVDSWCYTNDSHMFRDEDVIKAATVLESDLEIQGVTGIEDRLAPQIEETLADLLKAGIKIWMLTGDKFETAVNIGIATNLIPDDCVQISITRPNIFPSQLDSKELERHTLFELLSLIVEQLNKVNLESENLSEDLGKFSGILNGKSPGIRPLSGTQAAAYICIFDGSLLHLSLSTPALREISLMVFSKCKTVIFFRVAPQEKGDIVRLIREFDSAAVTLAVGDGANDCNMIQSAHVGVGIRGKEGLQAFNVREMRFNLIW